MVDDDPDDQEIFLMCLKNVSVAITCLTANNGIEALSLLNADERIFRHLFFLM